MNSPLAYDAAIIEEFKIKDIDLEISQKVGFVRAQITEMKNILWRSRQELIMAENQAKSKDTTVASNAGPKIFEHRFTIQQFVESIKILTVLLHELEKQLPLIPTEG